MILNFHGHILPGSILQLNGLLDKVKIDPALAHWCRYRLKLYIGEIPKGEPYVAMAVVGDHQMELCTSDGSNSADSVVLRTALFRLIEAIYADWETAAKLLPVKTIESAIKELETMIGISKEYPVMLWEFADKMEEDNWVSRTKAKLPSAELLKEFYELPHLRSRFTNDKDFYEGNDREAEKACRRALAERNRKLNRARRKSSLK